MSPSGWFGLGAAAATAVAVLFATVGDGVHRAVEGTVRQAVVDHGHTLTWALLALALWVATLRGGWTATSTVLAVLAGCSYLVFLAALLL